MRLHLKIIIPVTIVLIIAFATLIGVFVFIQMDVKEEKVIACATSEITVINKSLIDQKEVLSELKVEVDNQAIEKVKMVAYIIAKNPDIIENYNELEKLLAVLNIEEIHVGDEDGILQWGTVKSFYGFDFASSDQSKAFIEAIKNKDFELVQEPQRRGIDNVLFQYVGVSRLDKPGIIQIGVHPERLENQLKKVDVANISNYFSMTEDGMLVVVDMSNNIIVSSDETKLIGTELTDYAWGEKMVKGDESYFTYILEDEKYNMYYEENGEGYLIGISVNDKNYSSESETIVQGFIITTIIIILICMVAIYFLIKMNVIRPLYKVIEGLKIIENGKLSDKVQVNTSKEFGELSEGINRMTIGLSEVIFKVIENSKKIFSTSNILTVMSEQTSNSAVEVSQSINEIAIGANDQVNNTNKILETISELDILLDDNQYKLKELNEGIKQVENLKNEGIIEIKDLVKKSNSNYESTDKIQEVIASVNDSAQKINESSKMIRNIADQTNLLALNAAIEAARAGDAGAGFAVVADEIRKLAVQSDTFTEEIVGVISNLQVKTEDAVEVMKDMKRIVDEQNFGVDETKNKFDGIAKSIEVTKKAIGNLNQSGVSMKEKEHNILGLIENLSAISQVNAAGTEESLAVVQEQTASIEKITSENEVLIELAKEMNDSVEMFEI